MLSGSRWYPMDTNAASPSERVSILIMVSSLHSIVLLPARFNASRRGSEQHTHFLSPRVTELSGCKRSSQRPNELGEASSIISSYFSKEERELAGTAVGERLPYNDYATIDWLHDLVCSIGF